VFSSGAKQSVFLSLPWFGNFERTILGPGEQATVYGVEDAQSLQPIAALLTRQIARNGGMLGPAVVEGLSNYYTSYFGPAIDEDCRDTGAVMAALAEALWADRNSWDVCNFRPLDTESPGFSAAVQAFRQVGMVVQTYCCFGNWYLDVGGRSYEEYLATRPTVLRETIRRKGKKLEKQSGVRIEILSDRHLSEASIADYGRVYRASWKTPEPYPQFMPGLLRTCAEMGWLRLGVVYVDDEPAAAQLWIVNEGVASIYKLAYDERFTKLSVGTVLTARLMQHVLDTDKVSVVDYLTGDDAYKKDWMSQRRERWGIMAFNPRSPLGLAQVVRHVGGRAVKRVLQRIPRRAQAANPNSSRIIRNE
jgi:hypothetical protein